MGAGYQREENVFRLARLGIGLLNQVNPYWLSASQQGAVYKVLLIIRPELSESRTQTCDTVGLRLGWVDFFFWLFHCLPDYARQNWQSSRTMSQSTQPFLKTIVSL